MNILEEIIQYKYTEVAENKAKVSVSELEKGVYFNRTTNSLKEELLSGKRHGIIAEFKRKSPSKGIFNESFLPSEITSGYVQGGASGLSVLTDYKYFGGKYDDLKTARELNPLTPILRKDFMVDEYQILEAKSMGADVILLIAAAIPDDLLLKLARFAKSLGLETLLEVKGKEELENTLSEYIDIVGVNNRNLENFTLDINRSKEIAPFIPSQFVKISESGISKPEVIRDLKRYGFKGFLLGEAFMQTANPVDSFHKLYASI